MSTPKLTIKIAPQNRSSVVKVPQTLFYPSGKSYWPSSTSLYYGCVGGGRGVSLDMLSWDVDRLTPLIIGGADLVFKGQAKVKLIEFRVMWIGYVDPEEDKKYLIMIESEITTRAKLGHVVSILVSKFMTQHGILRKAVALASLDNIYDDSWQATLYIL